jgi:hypothetical protein
MCMVFGRPATLAVLKWLTLKEIEPAILVDSWRVSWMRVGDVIPESVLSAVNLRKVGSHPRKQSFGRAKLLP